MAKNNKIWSKALILFSLILITINCFASQTGSFEIKLNLKGEIRNVAFNVTLNYQESVKYPLIITLHQGGASGTDMRSMLNQAVHIFEAILVCPDDADAQSGMIDDLIDYCKSNYNVDTTKIIITGYSIGGYTAAHYSFDHYKNIAGFIGIAPAVFDYQELNYSVADQLPVAIITGSSDDFITQIKGMKNMIETNNGKLKYIEIDGVEHMDPYYSSVDFTNDWYDCYEFIFQNSTSIFKNNFQDTEYQIINQDGLIKLIILSSYKGKISISCHDINGKEIIKQMDVNISSGHSTVNIDENIIHSGIYIWSFTDKNGYRKSKKVYWN